MLTTIIIVVVLGVFGYVLRRNFRRFWHVLRTDDEHPDWEKLGADHYIADWERKFWKLPPREKETDTSSISEWRRSWRTVAALLSCGSEDAHPVVLAFPGASVLGTDSATEQERECCSGDAFCMRESKSRPRGGLGLGALGARSTSLR